MDFFQKTFTSESHVINDSLLSCIPSCISNEALATEASALEEGSQPCRWVGLVTYVGPLEAIGSPDHQAFLSAVRRSLWRLGFLCSETYNR